MIEILPTARQAADGADVAAEERRDQWLGALCILAHALPLYTFDLGPGETAHLPDLPGYAGPAAVLMGLEGGLRGDLAEQALTLVLPWPDLELRLRHWRAALATVSAQDLEQIAARFILPGGYLRQTAAMAVGQAGLAGRDTVNLDDVRHAGGRSTGRCSTAWPSG